MVTTPERPVNATSSWAPGPLTPDCTPTPANPVAQEPDDQVIAQKILALPESLRPTELGTFIREYMHLLLDRSVPDEIVRNAYLEELGKALARQGYSRYTLPQLRRLFDATVSARAQPVAEASSGQDDPRTRVHCILGNAPVSEDAVLPALYQMTEAGVSRHVGQEKIDVLPTPVVITRRLLDAEDGKELLELAWLRDGKWKRLIVDRGIIANKNKILDLASEGLPVTSNTSADVVSFLAEYENENLLAIPRTKSSPSLGWVDNKNGFLWGSELITTGISTRRRRGMGGTSDEETAATLPVEFQPLSDGDEQIAQGFCSGGTMQGWSNAVVDALGYDKVHLMTLASLCAPLLEILEASNPIIELCGDTSHGKTITLRIAASCWGIPNEKSPKAAISTWDITRVGVEQSLATINNLPLILDDTQLCTHKDIIGQVIYDVAKGRGRKRGSLNGTQKTSTWSAALLSSGETSATSYAEHGGARARVISLWGSPFGQISGQMGATVKNLNDAILGNYGHAGPAFVRYLLTNRQQWPTWKTWHRRISRYYQSKAGNNSVVGRMADVFATLTVTGILAAKALGIRILARSPIKTLWRELTTEAAEADIPARALRYVYGWAQARQTEFHGRREQNQHQPSGGWAGRWDPANGPWEYIAFFPNKINEILEGAGFEAEAILRTWNERGWLRLDRARQRVQVRIGTEHFRMVAVTRQSLEALDGTGTPERAGDHPWLAEAARLFIASVINHDRRRQRLELSAAEQDVVRECVLEAARNWFANQPLSQEGGGQPNV
jgi:putative DNA primase/helicase